HGDGAGADVAAVDDQGPRAGGGEGEGVGGRVGGRVCVAPGVAAVGCVELDVAGEGAGGDEVADLLAVGSREGERPVLAGCGGRERRGCAVGDDGAAVDVGEGVQLHRRGSGVGAAAVDDERPGAGGVE